jgi:HEAT repeat protein
MAHTFAFPEGIGDTSPRMRMGVASLALAAALVPTVAAAQFQLPTTGAEGRQRLRDRYKSPQNSARLDEALRKVRSDDIDTRLEGVRLLGEQTDPKATDALLAAAADPDARVRVKAMDTLASLKTKEATPLLVQQLFMRDTDLATKQRVLACLAKIGDPRATQPIRDFLARDVDPGVRGNAIYALGEIGDPSALPTLQAIVDEDDETLRGLALEAIRRIHARPAPDVILPALAGDRRGEPQRATP